MVHCTRHQNRAKNTSRGTIAGALKAPRVKEVLVTLRDRLEAQLENGGDRDPMMVHDLRDNMRGQLEQINEALVRIEEGKYGICANCLTGIATERLVARPYATLCADCQNYREGGTLERP